MTCSFEGKVALVTGGSRGIGHAISCRLAAAGASVILTSRDPATAEAVAGRIEGAGPPARGIGLDISDPESVDKTGRDLLSEYGRIPFLVNNAGVTRDNLLLRMKHDEWDEVLSTNLAGVYRTCRALLPSMVRGKFGRIVNVTSVVASAGNPGQTNYAASKAGVEGFTRSLAREVGSRGITVNCIAPGFIDTDMTRELGDDARKKLLDQVPLKRLGRAEEIAGAVAFLLSEDAAYITGTTLHVNGGMYL